MKTTINIAQDGPFLIENLELLSDTNGTEYEKKDKMALCRCGASQNKPFCDGSHVAVEFSGKKDRAEKYDTLEFAGDEITVVDNIGICSHAGECVKNSPSVFFSWEGEKRISNPNETSKDEIIETIKKCPSGSLAYKLDHKLHDEYFSREEIFIEKDGPLHVRGGIALTGDSSKELISKEHFTLCRCGASKNKPFCDGTHKKINFKAD